AHDRDARAFVGDADPAGRARRRVRLDLRQGAADGVRRDRRRAPAASAGADCGVHAPRDRADAGPVHSAVPRRLVPPGGTADRMMAAPSFPGIPHAPLEGAVPAWRAKVDAAQWRTACETVARTGGRLAALWASEDMVRALLVLHEGLGCLGVYANEHPAHDD